MEEVVDEEAEEEKEEETGEEMGEEIEEEMVGEEMIGEEIVGEEIVGEEMRGGIGEGTREGIRGGLVEFEEEMGDRYQGNRSVSLTPFPHFEASDIDL